jgi:molecular chaperone DnaK
MAGDNMTLGRFELTGIPAAPRGLPQIEVFFDIDANGIVNVGAKDLGTGKEQTIRVTASSGLSEEDIQRYVKEAEAHADEDKKRQQFIEARNQADNLIYTTEKSLSDLGGKVDGALRGDIEAKITTLKSAMEGNEVEALRRAMDELSKSAHKLAEQLYAQKSGDDRNNSSQGGASDSGASGADKAEDVVDADFTEVNSDSK